MSPQGAALTDYLHQLDTVEKLWQSVVISLVKGIDVLGTKCSTELTALQSFPASFSFS